MVFESCLFTGVKLKVSIQKAIGSCCLSYRLYQNDSQFRSPHTGADKNGFDIMIYNIYFIWKKKLRKLSKCQNILLYLLL